MLFMTSFSVCLQVNLFVGHCILFSLFRLRLCASIEAVRFETGLYSFCVRTRNYQQFKFLVISSYSSARIVITILRSFLSLIKKRGKSHYYYADNVLINIYIGTINKNCIRCKSIVVALKGDN